MDEGSNYTLEYYYSMNSGFYGWYSQDIVFSGAEQVDFTVDVTEWDCSVHIYASIYNTTGGNYSWVYSQSYHLDNPSCYQSGMELTDESGDYVSYSDIDPGTTDLIWSVSFEEDNIPEGHEFELTWYHIVDWDWDTRVDGSLAWSQSSDSEVHIPWNVSVTDFDCNVYAYAQLMTNTSDGWISVASYGTYLYPPCEPMPSGWFELQIDDQGSWADYWDEWNNRITEEGTYDLRFNASQLEEGESYEIHWDCLLYTS